MDSDVDEIVFGADLDQSNSPEKQAERQKREAMDAGAAGLTRTQLQQLEAVPDASKFAAQSTSSFDSGYMENGKRRPFTVGRVDGVSQILILKQIDNAKLISASACLSLPT